MHKRSESLLRLCAVLNPLVDPMAKGDVPMCPVDKVYSFHYQSGARMLVFCFNRNESGDVKTPSTSFGTAPYLCPFKLSYYS